MNSDLGNLHEEITAERIASYIIPLSIMNGVVDKFLPSYTSLSSKYSMLTRLQLCLYNLNKIELPNDVE